MGWVGVAVAAAVAGLAAAGSISGRAARCCGAAVVVGEKKAERKLRFFGCSGTSAAICAGVSPSPAVAASATGAGVSVSAGAAAAGVAAEIGRASCRGIGQDADDPGACH